VFVSGGKNTNLRSATWMAAAASADADAVTGAGAGAGDADELDGNEENVAALPVDVADPEAVEAFIHGPIQLPYVLTTPRSGGFAGGRRGLGAATAKPFRPPVSVTSGAGQVAGPPPPPLGRRGLRGPVGAAAGGGATAAANPELTALLATKRALTAQRDRLQEDVRRLKLAARCADQVRRARRRQWGGGKGS
jgi:hypothetical protein